MDTIVNPLKSASKSMGNAVKSVPDGMSKIGDGLGKVFTSQKQVIRILVPFFFNDLSSPHVKEILSKYIWKVS